MKLMTKELEEKFKQQGDTSEKKAEDIKIIAKYFSCFNGWTWYATEYDPETGIFFGFVRGFANELGSFGMQEFLDINKSKGFSFIERDLYFGDHTLAEAMERRI